MQAGIYLRVSQDRTGTELGVARQREDCEALAARRGWPVHRVYIDNDVSAKGDKVRPEWEAMMRDVEAGELQVIVGWTIDRTLRSGRDRLRMLEVGKKRGLLISLARGSDMDLSTPAGRLAADILGAVALNEIEAKSDRQKRAHLQAAQQGRRIGGRRPFGYEQDGVTIRPAEAEQVRRAYDDFLAGTPLLAIARRWNTAGLLSGVVSPTSGKPTTWDHSGVRWVLKNPRYAGLRAHNGEIAGPAQWPPLVSEATYRAAVSLLDSAAAEFKPRGGRRLLTGIARCGVCDEPIHVGGNKAGAAPVYRCPSGRHVTRRAVPVEEQVTAAVLARLNRSDFREALARAPAGEDGTTLAAQAQEVREEMDTIARERAQRTITPRQFGLMNAELAAQLDGLERRMALSGRSTILRDLLSSRVTPERWEAIGVDQQRVAVAAVADVKLYSGGRGVRVPPLDTVKVTWRKPSA